MSRALIFLCAATLLAGCGVKRPLIRPSDVPAYEAKRAQERAEREKERQLQTESSQ